MTTPELLEFVRIEHALGMPLSEISRLLLVEGEWDAEDVAEAFVDLGLPTEAIYGKEVKAEVKEEVKITTAPEVALAPVAAREVEPTVAAPAPAVEVAPSAPEITKAPEVVAPVVSIEVVPVVAPEPVATPEPVIVPEPVATSEPVVTPEIVSVHEPVQAEVHPLMEAREVVSAPVLTRTANKVPEEIFATGPVVEPFGVGSTTEPMQGSEVLAQMKAEEDRIASARAEEESRALEAKEAEAKAAEEKAAAEKAEQEKTEQEKVEAEKKAADEKAAEEAKAAAEKIEAEKTAAMSAEDLETKKFEDEAKAKIAEEKAIADKEAREAAEAKARMEVEARMKAEEEARIKIEAEMKVRAEMAAQQAVGQMAGQMPPQYTTISPSALGVPAMGAPIMMQAPQVIYAPMMAQAPAQSSKPAEPLTPMRAPSSGGPKPAAKPIEPAKPAPIKFDISRVRAGEVKPGMPGQPASMMGAIAGMSPVTAMSPEEFFKAQAEGAGGAEEGLAIARSLKMPHKRTMFGDIERMQEGTLPAQVSGASITPAGETAAQVSATTETEGGMPVAVAPVEVLPAKTGSPWMTFIIALVFLVISGALAGYYYFFYRLPADSSVLANESIAMTLAKGNAISYNLEIKANLTKDGGEQLAASVKSAGTAMGNDKGFGNSEHSRVVANIDHSGISDPVSFHFNGDIKNIDGKYYFKPEQSAGTSDALARAAGGWVSASPDELGVISGLSSAASLSAGASPVSTSFYDTFMAHKPWKEVGAVSRYGTEPVFLAPDEYSVPIALNPENMVALTDALSVIVRGTNATPTSGARRTELTQRYSAVSGSLVIDRKTHRVMNVELNGKYDPASGSVGGSVSFKLTLGYPQTQSKISVPPSVRTLNDVLGISGSATSSEATGSTAGTSSIPVIPVATSTKSGATGVPPASLAPVAPVKATTTKTKKP